MVPDISQILIGEGLGEIRFGWNKQQLTNCLGAPDRKEKDLETLEEEFFLRETWHYENRSLTALLILDIHADDLMADGDIPFWRDLWVRDVQDEFEPEKWELGCLTVSGDAYQLDGENLHGLHRKEVLKALDRLKLQYDPDGFDPFSHIHAYNPANRPISLHAEKIDFGFVNDLLTEISWRSSE